MGRKQSSGISAIIAIDKPLNLTSHDCVSRARRIFHESRIGHAGTLDPLATGVLVLGIGPATRLLNYLSNDSKSYIAQIKFGAQTSTDDSEGEVLATMPVSHEIASEDYAQQILLSLIGKHMQIPPQYSAIQVNGKRAYAEARKGNSVELDARPIEIYAADLLFQTRDEWTVAFSVSKGTYIRSIARDLGPLCNCVAHLTALNRTASGFIRKEDTVSFENLVTYDAQNIETIALNPLKLLGGIAYKTLNEQETLWASQGRGLNLRGVSRQVEDGELVAMLSETGMNGLWQNSQGRLKPVLNFSTPVIGVKTSW